MNSHWQPVGSGVGGNIETIKENLERLTTGQTVVAAEQNTIEAGLCKDFCITGNSILC